MSHLYKCAEWETAGRWYVNDVSEIGSGAENWWTPARILGISASDFLLKLKNEFKVAHASYDTESNVLIFAFANMTDARKYKNYINAVARKRNYICGL